MGGERQAGLPFHLPTIFVCLLSVRVSPWLPSQSFSLKGRSVSVLQTKDGTAASLSRPLSLSPWLRHLYYCRLRVAIVEMETTTRDAGKASAGEGSEKVVRKSSERA